MKSCTICGAVKPLEAFPKHHQMRDGHRNQCTQCRRQASLAWQTANVERRRANQQAWVAAHREAVRAQKREQARQKRARDPDGTAAASKRWKDANPLKVRAAHVARTYGISPADYLRMAEAANGCCTLCGQVAPLHVDHNHGTGRIRGLICRRCNSVLGWANDNPDILRLAIAYLERHR